jgi:hypothetical protein
MAEALSSSPRTEEGTAVARTLRMEEGGRLKSPAASLTQIVLAFVLGYCKVKG